MHGRAPREPPHCTHAHTQTARAPLCAHAPMRAGPDPDDCYQVWITGLYSLSFPFPLINTTTSKVRQRLVGWTVGRPVSAWRGVPGTPGIVF